MKTELVEFLATRNTIQICNENEFNKFLKILETYGLTWILGFSPETKRYSYWKNIINMNTKGNTPIENIIFEFDVNKGITFYNDVDTSIDWYGCEPYTISQIE